MPEIVNHTPYPNLRWYSTDNRGREFGIVTVKATCKVAPSGRLLPAEEQAPMMFTDACHGEVNRSSLWHPSDLVPPKPRVDVIVNAVARAPGGGLAPSWLCSLHLSADPPLEKALRVTGPRLWEPAWKRPLSERERAEWRRHRSLFEGWRLSEPEPIAELPLRYEIAYGGLLRRADENGGPVVDDDPRNPIGCGWIDADWTDHTEPQPAPQIELASDPVTDPYHAYAPEGLGPIPPAWEPRLPLGGTYDQHWRESVWPDWPADYDFAYHNSAHPDLIHPGPLRGDERITLAGLLPDPEPMVLRLPGERLAVDFADAAGAVTRRAMTLDTIFLDVAAARRRDWRVFLSWRLRFEPEMFVSATIRRFTAALSAAEVRRSLRAATGTEAGA